MSEGGILPWKVQRIVPPRHGRISSSYASLYKPLPDPPKDRTWVQDIRSREWKLVPLVVQPESVTVAARVTTDDEVEGGASVCDHRNTNEDESSSIEEAVAVVVPFVCEASVPPPVDDDDRGDAHAAGGRIRYHVVLPTDTFQGICLRYRVTPIELRRANNMIGGGDLRLAPESLVIPSSNDGNDWQTNDARDCRGSGRPTREEKISTLICGTTRIAGGGDRLTYSEALAYLEMAAWDVNVAIENAREDYAWSRQHVREEISFAGAIVDNNDGGISRG